MMRLAVTGRSTGGPTAYEVALRAIGQDLAALLIESLEITVEDSDFVAQGIAYSDASSSAGAKGFSRKAKQSAVTEQPRESLREPFARRYSAEDIKRLDELGLARQTSAVKTPDPSSLPESLRNIGRALDFKRGRLVKLFKDGHKFTLVYEDENGHARREKHYSLSLYKSQQEGLSLRGKKKDVWEDSK